MQKTKKDSAKNIRTKILKGDFEDTSDLQEERIDMVRVVQGMSSQVELLSKKEQEFFEKLIDEIKEIPKSAHDLRVKEEKVLEALVETAASLKIAIENEKDPEKKKKLEEGLTAVQEKGKKYKEETDVKPRSLKETLSMHYAGFNPRDVRKEGFRKTYKKEAKKLFTQIFNPVKARGEMSFEDSVNAKVAEKQEAANLENEPKDESKLNEVGEKTVSNADGVMKALLVEVSVIRKLVEGSIKYDPTKKEGQKYGIATGNVDEEGRPTYKHTAVSTEERENIRTAGTGLYTKKELGEAQGLSKSQIKKGSFTDIEKASAHSGIVSAETAALNSVSEKDDSAEAGTDIQTEATTSDVVEKLDKIAELLEKNADESGGGGGGGIDIPSPRGGLARRFMRGARGFARGAMNVGRGALALGGTSVGTAGAAAVGGTVVGGLAAGLAIGDQFNTSVDEGGSGNLSDWWRNSRLGGLRSESIAEREGRETSATNADDVARQRGFSSFREMQAANRNRARSPNTSSSAPSGDTSSTTRTTVSDTRSQMETAEALAREEANRRRQMQLDDATRPGGSNWGRSALEPSPRGAGQMLDDMAPQAVTPQPASPPVITNITNNNASPASPMPEVMPPVKPTDNSFLRYQDRRTNRVL